MSGLNTAWLSEPDQFDRVTAFLRQRGLMRSARCTMAIVDASAALIPISALLPSLHTTTSLVLVGGAGATLCAIMTWWWLTRWPSRRVSLCAVLMGSVCAAVWSLSQPSPAMAALACTTLTITGGYIAFFHNFRYVILNAVIAATAAITAAVRLTRDVGLATGLAAFWIMWLLNVAVPLGVRGMSKALTHYAIRSDEDPLTGLLNRRGFNEVMNRRLTRDPGRTAHLTVAMIDLDDFKTVNDTQGHAAGDRTLLCVAELLRDQMPTAAALCRSGGEEFLVAIASTTHDTAAVIAPLCEAIRTQCGGVTASIGVACAHGEDLRELDPPEAIDRLIDAADHAMYAAKRNGGNRIHHAQNLRCT